jgi:predicted dehydrogenase/nucleoside-diphosphate-sugar epimerase
MESTAHPDPQVATSQSPSRDPAPTPLQLDGPTRVAVVGAGYIADFHLEVLAKTPNVEVVAVCDNNRARAEAAAKKHGVAQVVTDLAELPGLGIQVAHLTVPPDLHVSLTRALLELGLGVFVEKPLALGAEDARALADLASARELPLAVNHNNVFAPAFAELLERVRAGEIGAIEHVQVTLSVPLRQLDAGDYTHWMFRAPRNIVFEQATHPISQLEALIGSVKSAKTTLLGTRELHPGQLFHDRWSIAAEAEGGTAELYLAFGQPFTRSTLQVLGSDGCLEADLFHDHLAGERKTLYLDFFNSFLAGTRRARELRRSAWRVLRGWMGFTLGISPRRDGFFVGMQDSIENFHAALRTGKRLPGDGPRAVAVAEWCDAIATGISGEAPPVPDIPAPGEARPGEVVVTGATGFIGRRVVTKLLERGVPVTAITRRRHALPPAVLEPALDGRLRLIETSLEDDAGLAEALHGAAACVHLATGGGDDWATVEHAMVGGSRRVGEACLDQQVGRLIYVSSVAALYGGPDAGVAEIGDDYPTDPRSAARPIYARGKIAAEEALLELHAQKNLPVTIARPGVVLGDGTPMQHSGIGLWVRDNHCVGWGRGEHPLPLVWVEDVAEALVRAALHEGSELDGKCWNLCARVDLNAAEMVEQLRRHTGRKLAFHSRTLWVSQLMEIGKWVVKKVGRRPGATFPSWRDLKSRSLTPPFRCETARELLGWKPVEEREAFLDAAVRVYKG